MNSCASGGQIIINIGLINVYLEANKKNVTLQFSISYNEELYQSEDRMMDFPNDP